MGKTKSNNVEILAGNNLADESVRERLSAPGFKVFLGIADKLQLNVEDRRVLLGGIAGATYYNWKAKGAPTLDHDQLERVSLVLGIWKGIKLLFADEGSGIRWIKARNTDIPFSGDTPLNTMLRGSIDDLYCVRRYIDGWRGVWP